MLPAPAAHCAAGYAWGEDGSNRCPASYYAIDTEAACESAATAAGKAYRGSVTDPSYPSGCFFTRGDNNALTLNADAVGTGEPGTQLLCSGAARVSPSRLRHHRVLWGTHGVIWGTHGVLRLTAAVLRCSPSLARPVYALRGLTLAAHWGTHGVLWGYSRGTIGYSRGTVGYSRGNMGHSSTPHRSPRRRSTRHTVGCARPP